MDVFAKGILYGMGLSVLLGPVFFALIQTSIEKGFRSGMFMAVGISLSDSMYIALTYLGVSQVSDDQNFKLFLSIVGGLIMLIFGASTILRPGTAGAVQSRDDCNGGTEAFKLFLKGFLLNGINPFVLLFWIGVVSVASVDFDYSTNEILIFFSGIIVTIFITDTIKSYLANKLRGLITTNLMRKVNMIVGALLIVLSLRLFFYAYEMIF